MEKFCFFNYVVNVREFVHFFQGQKHETQVPQVKLRIREDGEQKISFEEVKELMLIFNFPKQDSEKGDDGWGKGGIWIGGIFFADHIVEIEGFVFSFFVFVVK